MKTPLANQLPEKTGRPRRIAFLIYPNCDVIDVCGPCDAFHYAQMFLPRFGKSGERAYQCDIIAAAPGLVRTSCGIHLAANQSYRDASDDLDTLIVAGGVANKEEAASDAALIEWVRLSASRARRVASICTGAFILAAAGLLDNRRVTTHWMFAELLAKAYPSIKVDSRLIFARDGNVYTSGGISAGIDLALGLIEEDLGREVALTVARMLVVFPRRPNGQSQFSGYVTSCESDRPEICKLQAWILGNPGADLSVTALADRAAMSTRNFSRLFRNEIGATPAQFVEWARADAARWKLEESRSSIERIAEECGFGTSERMRRTFQRLFDVSPLEYRARFRSPLANEAAKTSVQPVSKMGANQ